MSTDKQEVFETLADFWKTVDGNFPGLVNWESDFSEKLNKHHNEIEEEVRKAFTPLIHTLDEGFQWLSKFYNLCEICFDRELDGECNNRFLSMFTLSGTACLYLSSLRKLILTGHDGPAKAILRSLADTLYSCIVIGNDEELATQFVQAKSEKEALKLWYKELTAKKINSKLSAIEFEITQDSTFVEEFSLSREGNSQFYSEFVHPWFLTSFICSLPVAISNPENHICGKHGAASAFLHRTLSEAIKLIWYFAHVSSYLIERKDVLSPKMRNSILNDAIKALDGKTEEDNLQLAANYMSLKMGLSVFSEVAKKYWDIDWDEYSKNYLQ